MTISRFKAVIFDHDGTLVNSEPVHWRCWTHALRPYGRELSLEEYSLHLSGLPSAVSATWIAGKFNLDVNPDALLASKQKLLREFLTREGHPLMPGVLRLLTYPKERGIPMAIASGADRNEVDHSLRFHALEDHFSAVATKNDVPRNKPAPDVYLQAARLLGVAPEDCIAIEDSDNGEKSARAANIFCLRLYPGNSAVPHPEGGLRFADFEAIHDWFSRQL